MNDPYDDPFEPELDELPPPLSSRIEHLSRKWTNDDRTRPGRPHRRTRRRIEDWRESRALARDLENEFERD